LIPVELPPDDEALAEAGVLAAALELEPLAAALELELLELELQAAMVDTAATAAKARIAGLRVATNRDLLERFIRIPSVP
jgi:hypothetical protein